MYWYEEEVRRIEKLHQRLTYKPEVVFYGSSSLRLWDDIYADFSNLKIVNLGFGGSTLAACTWFFERVMFNYQPKVLIIYAGDNDLGDGRHPEEILIFFQQIMVKAELAFGNIPCFFVSLKPSPARWHMEQQFRYTNNLIESEIIKQNGNWKFVDVFKKMVDKHGQPKTALFADDGLHLGHLGYALWQELIADALSKVLIND